MRTFVHLCQSRGQVWMRACDEWSHKRDNLRFGNITHFLSKMFFPHAIKMLINIRGSYAPRTPHKYNLNPLSTFWHAVTLAIQRMNASVIQSTVPLVDALWRNLINHHFFYFCSCNCHQNLYGPPPTYTDTNNGLIGWAGDEIVKRITNKNLD